MNTPPLLANSRSVGFPESAWGTGLTGGSSPLAAAKHGARQGQANRLPVPPAAVLFACAHADFRSGAGRPRAARIISRVHPAQHLYLSGSDTHIDRLSPAVSWPPSAHDGQRVTKFLPARRFGWT